MIASSEPLVIVLPIVGIAFPAFLPGLLIGRFKAGMSASLNIGSHLEMGRG